MWGDASLWWMIAEANGLTSADAIAGGMTLAVPNRVSNFHNTDDTFRPYDPNKAIGEVSPTTPAPPKRKGCGVFGAILMIIVAVVVSVVTYGALTSGAATFMGSLGTSLGGAGFATGAVAGAAGSVASQVVGLAVGAIDEFSWQGVAMAALAGGIGAGLGKIPGLQLSDKAGQLGNNIVKGAVRGAVGSAITQGVAKAVGLQDKFSWNAVAVAGVAGGVMAGTDTLLGAAGVEIDAWSATGVRNAVVSGMAGAVAGAGAQSLLDGSDFGDNIIAALPAVIGSTIGSAIGARLSLALSERPRAVANSMIDDALEVSGAELGREERKQIASSLEDRIEQQRELTDPVAARRALDDIRNFVKSEIVARTPQGREQLALAERLFIEPEPVWEDEPGDYWGIQAHAPDASGVIAELELHVVGRRYGEAFLRSVDPMGVEAGVFITNVGENIAEAVNRTPGAKTALTLIDWGVKIAGGPVRYVVGEAWSAGQDKVVEYSTARYERAGYGDRSQYGGKGVVLLGALALGGVKQVLRLGTGLRGLADVSENRPNFPSAKQQRWMDYEDGATGAYSDIATRQRAFPALEYKNPNPLGSKEVRWDGRADLPGGGIELVDRKLSVVATERGWTAPSLQNQLRRQSNALKQNPGFTGVIEVPNPTEAAKAMRVMDGLGIRNIKVRVAPEGP